jgi:hypothetical protein
MMTAPLTALENFMFFDQRIKPLMKDQTRIQAVNMGLPEVVEEEGEEEGVGNVDARLSRHIQ